MRLTHVLPALPATILFFALQPASAQTALNDGFSRDSRQAIDQTYTDHIRKYTTDPQFSSRLVDYLLLANNPVYRGETIGSYDLVFNAILNYDHLRQPVATPAPEPAGTKAVPTVR